VQGLETTATYIPTTQEFEIHSPSLTSCKWWIGGLGIIATHAVVVARLITAGKDHGPHTFIVPIRDVATHKPLPGITVGDVGPKFGFNTVDNGYILFDRVRIPRVHQLSRFAQVLVDGTYVSPPSAKLTYGTMVLVRAYIVRDSGRALARAATIAIRYSSVRCQFSDDTIPKPTLADGTTLKETQVIDYTMQQYRLFPLVAQTYALFITGHVMMNLYDNFSAQLDKDGSMDLMAQVHASSSGLKSLTTTMCIEGVETCRRACGGHGYSQFSGFPEFYGNLLPNATWEGDNYILTQQTGRYLIKTWRALLSNTGLVLDPSMEYMRLYLSGESGSWPVVTIDDLADLSVLDLVFGHRAAHIIDTTTRRLDQGETWNACLVDVARMSKAHCQYLLVHHFIQFIIHRKLPADIYAVAMRLCRLFALHTLENEMADVLQDGYVSSGQVNMVKAAVLKLLGELRGDMVGLVDAFALPDFLLHSALGRSDGRVYEAMCQMAEQEPHNVALGSDNEQVIQWIKQGKWDVKAKL
jgi:acyl-CoA oxidase